MLSVDGVATRSGLEMEAMGSDATLDGSCVGLSVCGAAIISIPEDDGAVVAGAGLDVGNDDGSISPSPRYSCWRLLIRRNGLRMVISYLRKSSAAMAAAPRSSAVFFPAEGTGAMGFPFASTFTEARGFGGGGTNDTLPGRTENDCVCA